jgi:hypothetical protein
MFDDTEKRATQMTWFNVLTGMEERSPDQVRAEITVDDDSFLFPNGNRVAFGTLEVPTLTDLRDRSQAVRSGDGKLRLSEVVADVRRLHSDQANANALFQVASQFNLLEMTGPSITPEAGVGIYEHDRTQGPACAIACGAGTIYRNYFVMIGDQQGQTASRQINCAERLGRLLGNEDENLWSMENGYLFPTEHGLSQINEKLESLEEIDLDHYRASLCIGLQWNTTVTLPGASHQVTQAYCSALPVAYGLQPTDQWTTFAKFILEAAYEATVCAAIINRAVNGSNRLYLTMLGGGVFGNREGWITDAIYRAMTKYRDEDLDVKIVSYGSPKRSIMKLIEKFESTIAQ